MEFGIVLLVAVVAYYSGKAKGTEEGKKAARKYVLEIKEADPKKKR